MKAFVFDKPGFGGCRDVELGEPCPDEVVIEIALCGVCGTDVHIWNGTEPAANGVVIGHEFAGTVVQKGSDVHLVDIGDRVAVDPNIPCGRCGQCRSARPNLCEDLLALGVDINGGFAEYCLAPETQLYKLPDEMTWEAAALVEPMACALHGIDRAGIRAGQTVLIIGGGPIGLIMLQLARVQGAGRLLLSEKNKHRQELGKGFGADRVIDPSAAPLCDQIDKIERPDVVIECVGLPETQEEAVRIARRGGTVVLFGCGPMNKTFAIDSFEIYASELTILGAALNPFTHGRALRLISEGRVCADTLVTRKITLEELRNVLENGFGKDLKVVVKP
jgi:L-iditol 2-dehydrogenase